MELLFNELSILPLSSDKYLANEKMKSFSETVATARKKGFRNIRSHYAAYQIGLSENYNLQEWLQCKDIPEIYRNNLYGMIILPFIKEEDEAIEAEYIESEYYFEDKINGIPKTKCLGLASAYLYEMPTISFASLSVWKNNILQIIIETAEQSKIEPVLNIATKESFDDEAIIFFVENIGELILDQTPIAPDEKKYNISTHHGIKELTDFWKKLKLSPYVIEMHSTDWGGKRFIRKIEKTGAIEIVLTDSQRQYAMWIQTTGKNWRETKTIAELLEEEYS